METFTNSVYLFFFFNPSLKDIFYKLSVQILRKLWIISAEALWSAMFLRCYTQDTHVSESCFPRKPNFTFSFLHSHSYILIWFLYHGIWIKEGPDNKCFLRTLIPQYKQSNAKGMRYTNLILVGKLLDVHGGAKWWSGLGHTTTGNFEILRPPDGHLSHSGDAYTKYS